MCICISIYLYPRNVCDRPFISGTMLTTVIEVRLLVTTIEHRVCVGNALIATNGLHISELSRRTHNTRSICHRLIHSNWPIFIVCRHINQH